MFNYAGYYKSINSLKRCQSSYDNMAEPDIWDVPDDEDYEEDDDEYWDKW